MMVTKKQNDWHTWQNPRMDDYALKGLAAKQPSSKFESSSSRRQGYS